MDLTGRIKLIFLLPVCWITYGSYRENWVACQSDLGKKSWILYSISPVSLSRKLANMCLNQLPLSHNTTEQLYENVFPVYLFSIYLFIYLFI